MEHGSIDLQIAPFSLRDCIESALQLIAEPAATKNLELVFDNKCPEVEVVYGDVTRFRQIIINLCGNAGEFFLAVLLRVKGVTNEWFSFLSSLQSNLRRLDIFY